MLIGLRAGALHDERLVPAPTQLPYVQAPSGEADSFLLRELPSMSWSTWQESVRGLPSKIDVYCGSQQIAITNHGRFVLLSISRSDMGAGVFCHSQVIEN